MKRILHGMLICALIVVVSTALLPASVSAAVPGINIYVDDDFIDDPSRHMWDTIQEGIADATDGDNDTVYVYAGIYRENVVVNKDLMTIHGESASLVTVDGRDLGITIDIIAENVTVRQLKVIGGDPAGVHWGNVAHGYLEKCDITDSAIGVSLQSLVNQTIQCNQIHNNTGDGIEVRDSELKDLTLNDISYNYDGISLYNSTKITIWYNKSYNNSNYGIYADSDSYKNDIYLNDFTGNTAGDGYSDRDPLDPDGLDGNNWQTPDWTKPGKEQWQYYCYYYDSNTYDGEGFRGNHWGDYGGVDNSPLDGIGDTSHTLGIEQDSYPLISSYTNYRMGTCPGQEVPSCTGEVEPPDPPTPATQNPPTNLTATAVLSDGETPTWQVELNWDDNSDDELGFKIERKVEGDATYSQIDTVGAGVTSYTDTDVVGGTTYYYRVRAYSSGGDSPYSNEASATTSRGGGGCFIATAAYGSYLDSHVETLRDFRDSYMVNNPVGSALVSAYYKLSPPVADFIDAHPTLKPIVRAGLLPAVAMSTVALNTTSAEKIAIVGSLALVSVALAAWARKRRGKGFTM